MKTRIIFMGTPEFSVPVLEAVSKEYDVVLVVTQPDKEVGRKKILTPSPVKRKAMELGIEVFTPRKIREDYEKLVSLEPDLLITCAYGQIIPKALLDLPRYGAINVHASLLPKLRGGAPIHKALIDGYSETGITIMYMNEKMDQGDILSRRSISITDEDDLESLQSRLSSLGTDLLMETLPSIINGNIVPIKQNEDEVTYAYNIKREEEHLDFTTKTSRELFNQIRGLGKDPGSYVLLNGEPLKVFKSIIKNEKSSKEPGTILSLTKEGIDVSTLDGVLTLVEIQPFGKCRMLARDYINGVSKESLLDVVLK